jgi:hypothetical protein
MARGVAGGAGNAGRPADVSLPDALDFTVGVENAHAMFNALNAVNVPAELCLYRGLEHLSAFF